MKKLVIVLLILLFGAEYVHSQTGKEYDAYKKEKIFSETFQDNQNNWIRFYNKIRKGRYVIETTGFDKPVITTIPVPLDTSRNYEIETEVSIEWNITNEFMGIVWNFDSQNGYRLAFNKNLEAKVYIIENGTVKALTETERFLAFLPMYEKNLITIRKIGAEYLIYVNKTLIYSVPYDHFRGNGIGYFTGSKSELRAYNLTLSYLENQD